MQPITVQLRIKSHNQSESEQTKIQPTSYKTKSEMHKTSMLPLVQMNS